MKKNKIVKTALALLIYFSSPIAKAQEDQEVSHIKCFNLKAFSYADVSSERYPTCESLIHLDKVAINISKISPIPLAKTVLAMTRSESLNGQFRPFLFVVNFDVPPKITEKNSEAVIAHELGHNIFDTLLFQRFPKLKRYMELSIRENNRTAEDAAISWRFVSDPKCMTDNLKDCDTAEQLENLEKKYPALPSAVTAKVKADAETIMDNLLEPSLAYHELFADVVASVYLNDPDAIANAGEEMGCRSFTAPVHDPTYGKRFHCAFTDLRVEFWNKWVKPRLRNKRQLLMELGNVLVKLTIAESEGSSKDRVQELRNELNLSSN